MKQNQYKEFRSKTRRQYDYITNSYIEPVLDFPNFIVTRGKHKGKLVSFDSCYSTTMNVKEIDGDGELIGIHYADLEVADENGVPVVSAVVDMTGREIEIGQFIVYSVSAGNSSHALEIGRVGEITKTGGVKVSRMVRNGKSIETQWLNREKTINDPDRSLLLPVEVPTLTAWVLQDFSGLKD